LSAPVEKASVKGVEKWGRLSPLIFSAGPDKRHFSEMLYHSEASQPGVGMLPIMVVGMVTTAFSAGRRAY